MSVLKHIWARNSGHSWSNESRKDGLQLPYRDWLLHNLQLKHCITLERSIMLGGVETISIPFDWYPHTSFYCAIVHLFSGFKTILCTLSNQSVMKMAQNCLSTAFLKGIINAIQHAFVCSRFLHNYFFVFLLILYMAFSCNNTQMQIILNWFSKSFIFCEWWKFFVFVN